MTDESQIPTLPAVLSADGRQLLVWCEYCERNHYHGAGSYEHKVAHCGNPESPYWLTGRCSRVR
jgi:hypothetical protein